MNTIKNLIAALFMFVCSTIAATDYTSNTGTITEFYDVYDYEIYTHTINIPGADAIKLTISMDVNIGMNAEEWSYGSVYAYISDNSYSTYYFEDGIFALYPELYTDNSYTVYVPNNIILELEGDMSDYWGGITVVYEKVIAPASTLLPNATQWLFDGDYNNFYIAHDNSSEHLKIYDKNNPVIAAHKEGKLGVGMQPTKQLDVDGATRFSVDTEDDVYLKFGNLKSSFDILSMESRGSAQIVIDSDNNNGPASKAFFDVRNDGTENTPILRVHQSGRVGIGGVLTPRTTLHVNGNTKLDGNVYNSGILRTKEVIIEMPNANWPDYVFTDTYCLLSLDAVEKHISEKGHLPSIPSAKEVAETGLSVGEMNKLLLQKVEELTLYMIEQEKRIKSLESKVD